MKLSLRDLFWLVLLMATLTAWAVEHRQLENLFARLRRESIWLRKDKSHQPSPSANSRLAMVQRLHERSDQQLADRLAARKPVKLNDWDSEYEPLLLEMVGRGMTAALQKHYDAIIKAQQPDGLDLSNLEALTALRRAEGKPDPLQVRVELPQPQEFRGEPAPRVRATITNVDSGRQTVHVKQGGVYRGGRLDRWQLILIDKQGRQVARSNFMSVLGGGFMESGPLAFGETSGSFSEFDLRKYFAPPASGKYQLQILRHNQQFIASGAELAGLIVQKSEPIEIAVTNPNNPRRLRLPAGFGFLMAMLGAGGLLTATLRRRGQSVTRRDIAWCSLIVLVALAAYAECQYQTGRIVELLPDAQADWSISLH